MSNTMITTNTNATEFTAVQTIPAEMKSNEVASKAPVILDANSTEMPSNETVSSEAVVVEANSTDMTSNEAVPSQAIVVDANSTEMTPNESVPSEAVVVEANPTDTIPNETVPDGVLPVEMIDDYVDRFSSANHPDLMIKKFPTGFEVIDRVMNGGLTAGVHTIVAQPGIGKSTFTLNLAINMAKNNIPVLFFSFEMPTLDLVTKSYSLVSSQLAKGGEGITFDDFRTERKWTPAETKLRNQTNDWVKAQLMQKIGFIDCKQTTVTADMIAKTIEHFIQTKHQLPLVIIDYLQLIGMDSSYATQKDNLDRAMKTFIGLVDKYSFPLIAISAIAKQNADSLSLFSASETSRIAYSSVSVLGLESKEGNDASYTTVNVKVLKNRYGQKPTDITLSFDGRYSRFFEFKPVKSTKGKKAAG